MAAFGSGADAIDWCIGHDGSFETWVLLCEDETPEECREQREAVDWEHLEGG